MTEFGRTPFFTVIEFGQMGYRMLIWPISSPRVANKAQEDLYRSIRAEGGAQVMVSRMQTRPELYDMIGQLMNRRAGPDARIETSRDGGFPRFASTG